MQQGIPFKTQPVSSSPCTFQKWAMRLLISTLLHPEIMKWDLCLSGLCSFAQWLHVESRDCEPGFLVPCTACWQWLGSSTACGMATCFIFLVGNWSFLWMHLPRGLSWMLPMELGYFLFIPFLFSLYALVFSSAQCSWKGDTQMNLEVPACVRIPLDSWHDLQLCCRC